MTSRPSGTSPTRVHANIVSWNHYDTGSRLAPHDTPAELLVDLRRFFRGLRTR